jgi:hypothetical protein
MADKRQQNTVETRPGQAGNLSPREQTTTADMESDGTLEQVEVLAAGAQENDNIEEGELGEKLAELAASTEEEVDALKINLFQEDERSNARDGSGRIVDDAAEERTARFTEADRMQGDLGAVSVEPGRDNTSAVLRRHHPNTSIARSDAVVEGNLDEPMDETIMERKVDEGTSG